MGNRPRAPRYSIILALAALVAATTYVSLHRRDAGASPSSQAASAGDVRQETSRTVQQAVATSSEASKARERFTYARVWATETRPEFLSFKRWTEQYLAADAARKPSLIAKGVELAKARRVKMASLIHTDPRGAIDATVPAAIRAQLPEEISAQLENRVSGMGDFEVLGRTEAGPNKQSTPAIFREVQLNGATYDAYVYGQRSGETTKRNIPIQGVALDRALAVQESALRALETDEPVSSAVAIAREPVGTTAVPSSGPTVTVQVGDQYGNVSVTHLEALASTLAGFEAGINPHPTAANLATILSSVSSGTKKADATAASLPSASWTTGPKKVLIALFDFPDLPGNPIDLSTNQAITPLVASSLITQAVNNFYVGSSYNKTSLTATADATLYHLPHTSVYYAQASNGSDQIMADARSLVSEKPDAYDRFIIIFPNLAQVPNSNITYGGLGYIGASGVWLNGWYDFATVAHELGHNYGLNHANAWSPASQDPVDINGQSIEYGDDFDVMGSGYDARADFNMYHKNELGWIPNSATTTIASSGTYRVYRFDDQKANLSNPLALKIVRNSTQTYWIGFRREYTDNSSLLNGAYVLFGYQQDTNKQSDQITFNYQESLGVGSYLCDQSGGFTIHTLKEGGTAPDEYLDIQVLYPTTQVLAATNIGSASFTANWTPDSNATGYSIDVATDQAFTQTVISALQIGNQTSAPVTGLAPQTTYYYRVRGLGNGFQLPTTNFASFTTTSVPLTVVHVHTGDSLSLTAPGVGSQTYLSWTRNLQSANYTFGPTFLKQNITLQDSGYYQATPTSGASAGPLARFFVVVSCPHSEVQSWSFNNSLYSGDTVSTGLHDLVQVAAGADNLALLKSDGTVYEWGDNSYGQNNIPAGLNDAVRIALGKDFTVVLHGDGTVSAWGRNDQGQCAVPAGLSDVAEIAAGTTIAVAVKTDGTLVAWGKNASSLPALSHVTGIGAADDQIVDVIEYDQELFEWIPGTTTATQQPGYINMKQLSGNNQELLAVTAWNTLAQLRTAPDSLTGTPPTEPSYIAKVATSLTTDLLLDLNGTIEAWGQNASLIPATSNVLDIAIGQTAAAAIVDDLNIPRFSASVDMPATVSTNSITVNSNVADATSEQWQLSTDNGSTWSNLSDDSGNYSGTRTAALTVSNISIQKNGYQYRLVASGGDGSATSNTAILNYYNFDAARLANVATRSFVGTGANVEIAGFIISGTQPKQVLIRAGGPSLTPYGVVGALADPVLTLYDNQQKVIGTNDDWDATTLQTAFATAHAPTWPVGSKDAAMLVTLQPGGYTAQVTGKNGQTGVALVEVYEYDSTQPGKLTNLSTRSFVSTGAGIQIAGFIVHGTSPKHVLIRAGGPSLVPYGVDGALADPVLTIFDEHQNQIATNDDWDSTTILPLTTANGIPAWMPGSPDAAIYLTLNPGGYTAQVTGKNGATGVALIEVFEMP